MDYLNKFKNASKHLEKAELKEFKTKKQYDDALNEKQRCEASFLEEGLLHFDSNARSNLLNRAEELSYSSKTIDYLRDFDSKKWNPDNVTVEDIRMLETIEHFVDEHTPLWKKSFLYKMGCFINETE